MQKHLADLGECSLFLIRNLLNVPPEFWVDPKHQETGLCHSRNITSGLKAKQYKTVRVLHVYICHTDSAIKEAGVAQSRFNQTKTERGDFDWRKLLRENATAARNAFGGPLAPTLRHKLESLTKDFRLSIKGGDIQALNGNWYVTHAGLVRLARRMRCSGIHVEAVSSLCDPAAARFVLKATVYPSKNSSGFVGYGDADPSNVSPLVRGSEMRVAETRAVNRALRKAYGIGLCSVEEIGSSPAPNEKFPPQQVKSNGNGTAPKVRDRLCQIIRQHQLDPELVKAYAIDFCGTKTLREASREQVENFVEQLADWAEKDRNALLCQLNSYVQPKQEVVA